MLGVEVDEVEELVIGIGVCVVGGALEEPHVRGGMDDSLGGDVTARVDSLGGDVTARRKELVRACGNEVDVPGSSVSMRRMATESDVGLGRVGDARPGLGTHEEAEEGGEYCREIATGAGSSAADNLPEQAA